METTVAKTSSEPLKLGIFALHPIQYQVPLYRKLAARNDVRVHVYYGDDFSVRGAVDEGFGVGIKWDVPLVEGYPHTFLKNVSRKPGLQHGFWGINCPEVKQIFRRERFDAVLVSGYAHLFCWQVYRAAWNTKTPTMSRGDTREGLGIQRPWWYETIRSTILKFLYRRMSIGLAVGTFMREHLLGMGLSPQQVVDSPHCVDDDYFESMRAETMPQRSAIRARFGIPEDAVVLLFSGKLIARKQPLMLARALCKLDRAERVWAFIVGDGEQKSACETAFREALGDRAIFPGFVNQSGLGQYYAAADVFVLPSAYESWGLVVNEAMIFGLPCIITERCACWPDLILEGKTGFAIKPDDVAALRARIQTLVDDADMRRRMGAACREHIRGFGTDAAVAGIVEGLRRAAHGGGLPSRSGGMLSRYSA